MAEAKHKGPSVNRTLTNLLSKKTNKMCADCRSALVDPLLVHASFSPSQDEISENNNNHHHHRNSDHHQNNVAVSLYDFQTTHRAFAPPSIKDDPNYGTDPARSVNQKFGGHGVFICAKCAQAHKCLGEVIAVVLPALGDSQEWTLERAQFMTESGGNARSWEMYEAFMPEKWKQRRPKPSSSQEERLLFIRAKYEALAFTMPPPGKLADHAWLSILERNEIARQFKTNLDLRNIHSLTPSHAPKLSSQDDEDGNSIPGLANELPLRLIDFFCVVSSSMQLHPTEINKDLSSLTSPEELIFWPQVFDCYPDQDTYNDDTNFPTHLPSFVLPDGCRPKLTHTTPKFFTFVLTTGDGDRLYGGSLEIQNSTVTMEELRDALLDSGYVGTMPKFLLETEEEAPEIVFFPKSLVLLSHYPFYDLFRTCLKQLNMLTLIEAPLPIERYITHLCREVPLPPQGRIKVEFSFTPGKEIFIERPPWNKLPMANFSYRPLFSSLSVGNIMLVLGCLMEEAKVVLLSQHYSMLCPVAEALLSALFPFEWQGLYIPIMPYAMLDVLDCPVPFLVGLNSRYLTEVDPKHRPRDLIYVDLDRDVVQLGYDEETGDRRTIPYLPWKDAAKLKTALDEHGGSAYMLPNSGIKGCVMSGLTEMILITNDERPAYSRMENVQIDEDALGRQGVFETTDKAYDETKDMAEIETQGHFDDDSISVISSQSSDLSIRGKMGAKLRGRKTKKPTFATTRKEKQKNILINSNVARGQGHLLDMTEPSGFDSAEIRKAFLKFFVTVFMDYEDFLLVGPNGTLFDNERFMKSLDFNQNTCKFLGKVIRTQMFQRFLEERKENPMDPEIRFFDESIIAKVNRSKMTKLSKKTMPTPFLNDEANKVTKTFTPPPPSNYGLPDNNTTYQYGTFPALDDSLFGRVRPAKIWRQEQSSHSLRQSIRSNFMKLSKAQETQRDIIKEAIKPISADRFAAAARKSVNDLETALSSLSSQVGFMKTPRAIRDGKIRQEGSKLDETERSEDSEDFDSLPESIVIPLSRSDTIIINARRKQAILLDVIIKFQAICRMFLVQRKHSFGKKSGYKGLNKSASIMQKYIRGYLARKKFALFRDSAILIQKHIKSRRSRFIYSIIRELVSKAQARIRGVLIRKQLALVFAGKMKLYRQQVFSLWQSAFVPLSFRTKLWPTFSAGESFSRLRLCETEIIRLMKIIELRIEGKDCLLNDSVTQAGARIGMNNEVYCMCKHLSTVLQQQLPEKTPQSLRTFEGFEQAERLQLYDRLDSKSFADQVGGLYELFGVPLNEKKKKQFLAQTIWNNYSDVENSVSTMLLVFPELEGSLNIAFHDPSAKSKRRFNKACKVVSPPVQRSLWEEASLEGTTKKHMQEVARIYITKVPALMAKLDGAAQRNKSKWETHRKAAMKASGKASWEQCRHELISDYLSGRRIDEVSKGRTANKSSNPFDTGSNPFDEVNGRKTSNPFEVSPEPNNPLNPLEYEEI